ncbi:MAG: hypothetical protein JSS11_11040 [Verrucomicrobia bacterium]|nr:hypothetical protein [Verrucomicrobiota bacterium]
MSTADRKRLLVALCACDRVELCLHRFQPADPRVRLMRYARHFLPWLGLLGRLFPRRPRQDTRGPRPGPSPLSTLLQLALGFFTRR